MLHKFMLCVVGVQSNARTATRELVLKKSCDFLAYVLLLLINLRLNVIRLRLQCLINVSFTRSMVVISLIIAHVLS